MVCRLCGTQSNPGARFCKSCGVSLAPAAAVSSGAAGHPAAGRSIAGASAATPGQRKAFAWVWPAVDTPEAARYAVRQAFWGAIFVCAVTALLAFIAMSSSARLPVGPSALVDAAIFGAIAFGLWKESRVAAVAGLVVYAIERFHMMTVSPPRGAGTLLVIVALTCAFIGGIRGTFALHEMRARGLD